MNKKSNLPAIALDFEATDATDEAQATEIGYCPVGFADDGVLNPLSQPMMARCKPDREISFGSMAITGLCPEDVEHELSHKDVIANILPIGAAYIIGHNIDYDVQVAANAGIDTSEYRAICTLAIARSLYPDAEHSLGALLYRFDYAEARRYARDAHSAYFDVRFCVRLLRLFCRELGITDMQSLYEYSQAARIPKNMPMGQFKGMAISSLTANIKQRGYLFWVIGNVSDQYLIEACIRVAQGFDLLCIKGNRFYKKGELYKIDRFIDKSSLFVINGNENHIGTINDKNIVVSFIDDSIDDALLKAN